MDEAGANLGATDGGRATRGDRGVVKLAWGVFFIKPHLKPLFALLLFGLPVVVFPLTELPLNLPDTLARTLLGVQVFSRALQFNFLRDKIFNFFQIDNL